MYRSGNGPSKIKTQKQSEDIMIKSKTNLFKLEKENEKPKKRKMLL